MDSRVHLAAQRSRCVHLVGLKHLSQPLRQSRTFSGFCSGFCFPLKENGPFPLSERMPTCCLKNSKHLLQHSSSRTTYHFQLVKPIESAVESTQTRLDDTNFSWLLGRYCNGLAEVPNPWDILLWESVIATQTEARRLRFATSLSTSIRIDRISVVERVPCSTHFPDQALRLFLKRICFISNRLLLFRLVPFHVPPKCRRT